MMPIIDALRYLHESGIVHRDLKVNIFIIVKIA